jgi:hypothetical protein
MRAPPQAGQRDVGDAFGEARLDEAGLQLGGVGGRFRGHQGFCEGDGVLDRLLVGGGDVLGDFLQAGRHDLRGLGQRGQVALAEGHRVLPVGHGGGDAFLHFGLGLLQLVQRVIFGVFGYLGGAVEGRCGFLRRH